MNVHYRPGGFTSWTATELARRAEPKARMSILLELNRIPKASFVVPEAVKLWWESRGAGVNDTEIQESEDAKLDFLVFLSEKRGRAELFKLVTADKQVTWTRKSQMFILLFIFWWCV